MEERREGKIHLIGAQCLIKEDKNDEKTKGGIIVPGREKEHTARGTVISVGPGARFDDGKYQPMTVKEGDRVIYTPFAGHNIKVDDDTYMILIERDILCIMGEDGLTPIGNRCIIKEEKLDEKTDGGIIIPGRDKEKTFKGTVLYKGIGTYLENGTLIPVNVEVGEKILYMEIAGSPIEIDGVEYTVLNERDIICGV